MSIFVSEGKMQLGRVVSCSAGGGCDSAAAASSSSGGGNGCFSFGDGFYANEEKKLEFLETMHVFCSRDAPAAVRAFDLTQFKTACDLGGISIDIPYGLSLALRLFPRAPSDAIRLRLTLTGTLYFINDRRQWSLFIRTHRCQNDWRQEK